MVSLMNACFLVSLIFHNFVSCHIHEDTAIPGCKGKIMDIFFLLDKTTSASTWDNQHVALFITDTVSGLDVSANETRVGLLTFTEILKKQSLFMNRTTNKLEDMPTSNIQDVPPTKSISSTHDALKYVRENKDFRQKITKVIVLITNGVSRDPNLTIAEAEEARKQGFYIFVIGIGPFLKEWQSVASDPVNEFLYNTTSFQTLESVRMSVLNKTCALTPLVIGGSPENHVQPEFTCSVNEENFASLYYISGSDTTLNLVYNLSNHMMDRTRGDHDNIHMGFFFQNCYKPSLIFSNASDHCPRSSPSSQTLLSVLIGNTKNDGTRARQRRGDHNQVAVIVLDDAAEQAIIQQGIKQLQEDDIEVILVDESTRGVYEYIRTVLTIPDNYVRFINQDETTKNVTERTCSALHRPAEDKPLEPV